MKANPPLESDITYPQHATKHHKLHVTEKQDRNIPSLDEHPILGPSSPLHIDNLGLRPPAVVEHLLTAAHLYPHVFQLDSPDIEHRHEIMYRSDRDKDSVEEIKKAFCSDGNLRNSASVDSPQNNPTKSTNGHRWRLDTYNRHLFWDCIDIYAARGETDQFVKLHGVFQSFCTNALQARAQNATISEDTATRMAFLLCRPTEYNTLAKTLVMKGTNYLLNVLEYPDRNSKGELDPRMVKVKQDIIKMFTDRVFGGVVQKTLAITASTQTLQPGDKTKLLSIDEKIKLLEQKIAEDAKKGKVFDLRDGLTIDIDIETKRGD